MIPARLDDIAEAELLALIANGVAEGRTIEYKRGMPGNTDADKKEFLADVSSFANTAGGDIVFGMDETAGLPTQVVGLTVTDLDLEIRRLDSILAAGLSPRIRYATKTITTATGQRIFVIRINRSWAGPHRIIFQKSDKFYGRNSAGKYPLDVEELRNAFTLSNTAVEKIRSFRTDRIIALSNNQTPLPFADGSKIVLHSIPVEAFATRTPYDISQFYTNPGILVPIGTTAWNWRLNLDGILTYGSHVICHTYTQLYRNGVVEAVEGRSLNFERDGRRHIPSISYERYIFEYLPRCFQIQQALGVNPPVIVALTLIGTKGLYMGVDTFFGEEGHPIEEPILILPETMVESFTTPVNQVLRPLFDLIWNACGFQRSTNFRPRRKLETAALTADSN